MLNFQITGSSIPELTKGCSEFLEGLGWTVQKPRAAQIQTTEYSVQAVQYEDKQPTPAEVKSQSTSQTTSSNISLSEVKRAIAKVALKTSKDKAFEMVQRVAGNYNRADEIPEQYYEAIVAEAGVIINGCL